MSKLWKNEILFFELHFFAVHLQWVLYAFKREKRMIRAPCNSAIFSIENPWLGSPTILEKCLCPSCSALVAEFRGRSQPRAAMGAELPFFHIKWRSRHLRKLFLWDIWLQPIIDLLAWESPEHICHGTTRLKGIADIRGIVCWTSFHTFVSQVRNESGNLLSLIERTVNFLTQPQCEFP